MKTLIQILYFGILLTTISCKQKQNTQETEENCMDRIINLDDSLGTVRNHASEKISLSLTIKNYADGLNKLDFKTCPEPFSNAFKNHEIAWRNMIGVTDNHSNLRGEMHNLFDKIEATEDSIEFKKARKQIWDTWSPIKQATTLLD